MRKITCLALWLTTLAAAADQTTRFEGFVVDVGGTPEARLQEVVKPRGPIAGIPADELKQYRVGDKQFVARMGYQIVQTVVFDPQGTAYLYYKRLNEAAVVQISKESGAAEGAFEVDGWIYVINQSQVYGLDDSLFREAIGHLGRLDREHIKVIAKGATLGVATLITGMLASWLGVPHAVPAATLAAFAAGGYYGWLRRDRFKMTQMENGFAGNRFTRKIADLKRVISYRPTDDGDVMVLVAVPGENPREVSVRALQDKGRIKYRKADCEVYLSRIRTMNAKALLRNTLIPN